VGGGESLPVLEIVRRLIAVSGLDVEPEVRGDAPADAERREVDSSAIRDELGWEPAWDLDRGLEATYGWYRGYLDERG
jgi:CDP-glucose 4,6-dehydratase